ncbi:hypothetical protein AB4571_18690 [Vibrio breoganii]|nr:hypothetical protein BCT84_12465 [Vibrio breoganii]
MAKRSMPDMLQAIELVDGVILAQSIESKECHVVAKLNLLSDGTVSYTREGQEFSGSVQSFYEFTTGSNDCPIVVMVEDNCIPRLTTVFQAMITIVAQTSDMVCDAGELHASDFNGAIATLDAVLASGGGLSSSDVDSLTMSKKALIETKTSLFGVCDDVQTMGLFD